jgi:ribosomal protein S3AE
VNGPASDARSRWFDVREREFLDGSRLSFVAHDDPSDMVKRAMDLARKRSVLEKDMASRETRTRYVMLIVAFATFGNCRK